MRIEERPVPQVGPGQMLVKIAYVGICGTDVELYKTGMTPPLLQDAPGAGPRELRRGVPGGRRVTKFKVGDRVLCGPPAHCAEDCPSCKKGMTNICIHGFPRTAGTGTV